MVTQRGGQIAKVATARKLLEWIYHILKDGKSREEGIPWMKEPVHDLLLGNDIILPEHLTNLDKVANRRIIAGFFPLPLKGMDGAPMRAVAFVED